jgi:hypothetical protein
VSTRANIRQEPSTIKREQFITPVTCPQCARNGSAAWEEDERRNLQTRIKSISHGFMVGPGTEIYCDDCGVKAIFGRTLSRSELMTATALSARADCPNVAADFRG